MNVMDPAFRQAVAQRPFPEIPFGPEHRQLRKSHLDRQRHLMPVPRPVPEVTEKEIIVTARDGYPIHVRTYMRTGNEESSSKTTRPLIVLFHEGGWCMGDFSDEESNARLFARDLNATCLNVEYRLAPEHPFPTGVLDCWDVLKWAATHPDELNADPRVGFVVGGSSAGANIAAVLAHHARNQGLQPSLTGQWLSVPYLFPPEHVPAKYKAQYVSMWQNSSDPVLPPLSDVTNQDVTTTAMIMEMLKADIHSPLFSVFAKELYPPREIAREDARLAKAFLQVAGLDPLRDHGLVYEEALRTDWNVETKLVTYPGFGHMFWPNWPEMERSKDYWRDMQQGMRWLLYGDEK